MGNYKKPEILELMYFDLQEIELFNELLNLKSQNNELQDDELFDEELYNSLLKINSENKELCLISKPIRNTNDIIGYMCNNIFYTTSFSDSTYDRNSYSNS